jgi:hypothetical protein
VRWMMWAAADQARVSLRVTICGVAATVAAARSAPSVDRLVSHREKAWNWIGRPPGKARATSIVRPTLEPPEELSGAGGARAQHKTIDSLLARGEKLDSLVEKSTDLSMASQVFYKQARRQNQCCVIA